jgi:hypothetical protein
MDEFSAIHDPRYGHSFSLVVWTVRAKGHRFSDQILRLGYQGNFLDPLRVNFFTRVYPALVCTARRSGASLAKTTPLARDTLPGNLRIVLRNALGLMPRSAW